MEEAACRTPAAPADMEGLELLVARIRAEAGTRGPSWVTVQLAAMGAGTSAEAAADSAPLAAAEPSAPPAEAGEQRGEVRRQSRPPERLSPDPHAGARRRSGSPIRDPPPPPAKRTQKTRGSGGRNPTQHRDSSGAGPSSAAGSSHQQAARGDAAISPRAARQTKRAQHKDGHHTGAAPPSAAAAHHTQGGNRSSAAKGKSKGSAKKKRRQDSGLQQQQTRQEQHSRSLAHGDGSASEVDSVAEDDDGTAGGSGMTAGRDLRPGQPGPQVVVWIVGHSYVSRGARRADVRPEGRQLGFPRDQVRIRWIGFPGMVWPSLLPELHTLARLDRPPDILVLHVGGNDLAARSTRVVIKEVKFDFLRIRSLFPETIVVWSDIVARGYWRLANSVLKINKARIKLNKEVARFFIRNGGLAIRHFELEEEIELFLKRDGVHLNDIGMDLWALGIEDGIQRALRLGASRA
ncbi:uncharacterized protein [Hyperolius riggenbachi]|uniref:uncharacterized protein n=1 Tax=Hyperolius riggenbachi TaxID=752182 RepID=UPI0035A2CED6